MIAHLNRENRSGLKYSLFAENETQTRIVHNKKYIVVDMTIDELSQCWYNWQMRGMTIQLAFKNMPAEYREFLLTGITPDEWNDIFKEEE